MTIQFAKPKIAIKTAEQIAGIKRACVVAAQTVNHAGSFVKPGVTTNQLDTLVNEFLAEAGAVAATLNYKHPTVDNCPYPAASCISVNEVVCHGIPTDRILKEGDIVSIDITTIVDGYFGDTCKTFPVGRVSRKTQDLLDTAEHCLYIGVYRVKPNRHFGDIGYAISNYANKLGYGVVLEFCGHGVGLALHEAPQVPHIAKKNTGELMKPGMIFTVEPMINAGKPAIKIAEDNWSVLTEDGQLSAQFEHTVLVTENGFEILTRA